MPPSITTYADLIKNIPVLKQSTKIKKEVWKRFDYNNKLEIENAIFGTKAEVEISREDIFNEKDTEKKIVMTLMWGYPTGGRGSNITNLLKNLDNLKTTLDSIKNKNLSDQDFNVLIQQFKTIPRLGMSTWSKFLYFFNVKIELIECQIFDIKIVESLNKKQFSELIGNTWEQTIPDYRSYIKLAEDLANKINSDPEQVELFMFYFNYSYKF